MTNDRKSCPIAYRLTAWAIIVTAASPTLTADPPKPQPDNNPSPIKSYTQSIPGTKIKFDMIAIPVGEKGYPNTFLMGSPETEKDRREDEGPQVEIAVEPFWIGKHEVTWDEFEAFANLYFEALHPKAKQGEIKRVKELTVDGISVPTPVFDLAMRPIRIAMGYPGQYPAVGMTQLAAKQYTKWLSKVTGRFYRLPTEAEWEYACRAGTKAAYSFGEPAGKLTAHAWFFDNSQFDLNLDLGHPDYGASYRKVALKKPNPWGLYDMHGNVGEWCIDQYVEGHYTKLAKLKGPVKWRDAIAWPTTQYPRVIRGGSWDDDPYECRSASRDKSGKHFQDFDPGLPKSLWWTTDSWHVGFRVVRPLHEPSDEDKQRYWDADTEYLRKVLKDNMSHKQVQLRVTPADHE